MLLLLGEDLISNHVDVVGHLFKRGGCDGCPADYIINKMGYLPFLFISVVSSYCIHNPFHHFIIYFPGNLHLIPREGDIQVASVESGRQLGWEELVGSHEIACMKWSSQVS